MKTRLGGMVGACAIAAMVTGIATEASGQVKTVSYPRPEPLATLVADEPVEAEPPTSSKPSLEWDVVATAFDVLDIAPGSDLVVQGPLTPGSWIVEVAPDPETDFAIQVPKTDGTFFSVWVDTLPGAAFDHPTWMGWVRAEDGWADIVAGNQRTLVLSPDGDVERFVEKPLDELGGVAVSRGVPVDPEAPVVGAPPADGDLAMTPKAPPVAASQPAAGGCQKIAIVFDAGDYDDPFDAEPLSSRSVGREMFDVAGRMATALGKEGYSVRRYSNFIDTWLPSNLAGKTAFARNADGQQLQSLTASGLTAAVLDAAEELDAIPTEGSCCHELLVYVVGHGLLTTGKGLGNGWGLNIYPGDTIHTPPTVGPSGLLITTGVEVWSALDLLAPYWNQERTVPENGRVHLTFFVESCGSGGFALPLTITSFGSALCAGFCGIEAYTTSDSRNATMVDDGLAVTDYFLMTSPKLPMAQRWKAVNTYLSLLDWDSLSAQVGILVQYGSPQHQVLCP